MLPGNIKNKIVEYRNGTDLELEVRYGYFFNNRFKPGVNRQTFNRVKDYFDKQTLAINEISTDYTMKDVRKSVFIQPEPKEVWITKTRLWKEDIEEYPLRYSMSREKLISPIDPRYFKPTYVRTKNRFSYFIFDNSIRIDMTLATSDGKISHEIEVELLDLNKVDKFELAVKIILRLVLNTYEFYTETEKADVIRKVNSILGSTERRFIDHYPLVQARNLKLRDMVEGGLIGNPETGYTVTHKTDGQRRLLVFLDSGIWLVSPTDIMRVSRSVVNLLTGTILDGEMVPEANRLEGAPKNRIWYLIFDTIAVNKDSSIQNRSHLERMKYAQNNVINSFNLDVIKINTKTFRSFGTPNEFFEIMRDMYREQPLLAYKQDGFMFTPANTKYNPHSDEHRLSERILTKYPDICKWKPKDELTIDFQIRDDKLYVNFKGKPVLFKGTFINPFFEVDFQNPLTVDLPNDTIVEYGYDYEKKLLVPRRVRHDKNKPNRQDVAEDVWNDIHDPIEKETMEGNTFALLRKYHNRIKKELFESTKDKRTLLDIGSGYGGDLGKWRHFDKIVAVEPDLEHIAELIKRIQTYGMENKVKIVHAGGEEIEKISTAVKDWIGDRVDVISSMLSLTFFWQNSKLVDALVRTIMSNIKEGGKYLFFTMDGDLVKQTFEPAFYTGLVLDKLELGPATLEFKSPRMIFPSYHSLKFIDN